MTPPLPALVALALAAMLAFQWLGEGYLHTMGVETAQRKNEALQLRVKKSLPQSPVPAGMEGRAVGAKAQLDDVLSKLSQQPPVSVRVHQLHQMADQSGVVIRKANYKATLLSGGIARHDVQAELAGTYPAIRQFVSILLEQDEAAAVESIEFSKTPGNGSLRGQLRLALYSRELTP